jgi:hypothetical protein
MRQLSDGSGCSSRVLRGRSAKPQQQQHGLTAKTAAAAAAES